MFPNEQEIRNYVMSAYPELPMVEVQMVVMSAKLTLLGSQKTIKEVVDELLS